MLDHRFKGLLELHGVSVLILLQTLFVSMVVLSAEVLDRVLYEMVHFPVYMGGILVSSLISFHFYTLLRPEGGLVARTRAIYVANLQALVLSLVLFGLVFATKDQSISRILLGSYLVVAWVSLMVLNAWLPALLGRVVFRGRNARRCVLVGGTAACARLKEWLSWQAELGLQTVGLVAVPEEQRVETPVPVIGEAANLRRVLQEVGANQVVLLETRQNPEWVQEVVQTSITEGCRLLVYNPWSDYFQQTLRPVSDGPHVFFTLQEEPLEDPWNRAMKRALDLFVAVPMCVFVLPPLAVVTWVSHRLQSPGPLFFRQVRHGLNRQKFTLLKFRTMHHAKPGTVDEAKQASRRDPRIFPLGEVLRRTSVDEFPQFWNVLRGEMSIVGPRPHLPQHDKLFGRLIQDYPQRHLVKPGITGLAQSRGYRGEITQVDLLEKRIKLDLYYIQHWSLVMDVIIILRTAVQVFFPPKTAY